MVKPLVRFCEGPGNNCDMDEILWHRRESRRQTENTNLVLQSWESPAYSKMIVFLVMFEQAGDCHGWRTRFAFSVHRLI